jgi:hypothetical protein
MVKLAIGRGVAMVPPNKPLRSASLLERVISARCSAEVMTGLPPVLLDGHLEVSESELPYKRRMEVAGAKTDAVKTKLTAREASRRALTACFARKA